MNPLLKEIGRNPLLWLLALVPVLFIVQNLRPEAPTLLFVLSVLAIVPLAALLSHATESVAAKTGDTVGGLLNATLTASFVSNSGRSAWFTGVLVLAVYLTFAITLYLLPPRLP